MFIAAYFGITLVIAFLGAFIYSTAWNWIVPALFGLPEASMLQAYVVVAAITIIWSRPSHQEDFEDVLKEAVAQSLAKMVTTLIIFFTVKILFL